MTPPASLLTSAFAQLAGFAFAQLRTVIGLAGPVLPSAHSDCGFMVQPGPRAVTLVQFGSRPPVGAHAACLLLQQQRSTEEWADASTTEIPIIQRGQS